MELVTWTLCITLVSFIHFHYLTANVKMASPFPAILAAQKIYSRRSGEFKQKSVKIENSLNEFARQANKCLF